MAGEDYLEQLAAKSSRPSKFELPDEAKDRCRLVYDAIQKGDLYISRRVLARDLKDRFKLPVSVGCIDDHVRRLWGSYAQEVPTDAQ